MTASDTHLANCETHTWTGSGVGRVNEDYALFDERLGCAVLVDGATGLTKANIVPGTSDAAWYARTLSERLLVHLADPKTTMTDAFVAAGREAAEAFRTIPGAEKLARMGVDARYGAWRPESMGRHHRALWQPVPAGDPETGSELCKRRISLRPEFVGNLEARA